MKNWFLVLAVLALWAQLCNSRAADSESVVSDYTGAGVGGTLDVYKQIAGNIAEKITQPIYRFFGLENSTKVEKTTKRPFEHIELDSSESTATTKTGSSATKPAGTGKIDTTLTAPSKIDPQPNEIPDRDVEELSEDSVQKSDKKPEKITLFSSYLPFPEAPPKENLEILNVTTTESSDKSLELDDVEPDDIELEDEASETGRGPFVYILELIGSIIQLLWGGFLILFKPSSNSS